MGCLWLFWGIGVVVFVVEKSLELLLEGNCGGDGFLYCGVVVGCGVCLVSFLVFSFVCWM